MSSSEVTDQATKKARYNEYMRDYRLLNPDKVKKIEKNRYYKNKVADTLTPDEIAKYKDYLDKVYIIKKAISDLMSESPDTAYAVVMDTVHQLEAK
jgi:hypothetical protein